MLYMNAIGLWIIIKDRRVLLIKRSKNKKNYPNNWTFPWGRHEWNETIEETAIREVKEEVWLDFTTTDTYCEEIVDWWNLTYYLWEVKWKIELEESECDWYGWFTYEETLNIPIRNWIRVKVIELLYNDKLII
jgi:8-oxo-dGTP pyrophosphatase MutT (NUDIX family)